MRLSMWMLADWLKRFHPVVQIEKGERCLRNVRLYSDDLIFSKSTVYLNPINDQEIMCSNRHDILILHSDDINEVFNAVLDAFDYYNEWSGKLHDLIANHCELKELIDECANLLGSVLVMADSTYYMREISVLPQMEDRIPLSKKIFQQRILPLEEIMRINQLHHIREANIPAYQVETKDLESCTVANLFAHGKHQGWLIAISPPYISNGFLNLQDTLGEYVAEWLEYHDSFDAHLERAGIFLDILEKQLDTATLYQRMETLGWYEADQKQVYLIARTDESLDPTHAIDRYLEFLNDQAYLIHYQGNLIYIINQNLSDPKRLEKKMLPLFAMCGCTAGKSPAFTDILRLEDNIQAAQIALQFSDGKAGTIYEFNEAQLPYLVSVLKEHAVIDLVHPALHVLRNYDSSNGTELFRTLQVFLEKACSYADTSTELFIHRSTLLYRMNRIQEISGLDLENASARLHLQISYLLME